MVNRKRWSWALNLAILTVTLCICFIVSEIGAQLILGKVNYLQPYLIPHSVLGHVVKAGTAGHDEWGFRNSLVPQQADIVAIGDSQTYGVSATAENSWPASLEKLLDRSVYNLSLGGYGPTQYLHLLKEKSLHLSPRVVIIGFYFGNDLADSYRDAAEKPLNIVNTVNLNAVSNRKFLGRIRNWLSHNSVLYPASKYAFEKTINRVRFAESSSLSGVYNFKSPIVSSAFEPRMRFEVLDQSRDRNRIGLRRTLEFFSEATSVCRTVGIDCWTVLIPTKESVYWPIAKIHLSPEGRQEVSNVVEAETVVRELIIHHLENNNIPYINPLNAMLRSAKRESIYPDNHDGHPLAGL